MQQRIPFYQIWLLRVWHWLDKRYALQRLLHALLNVPIPRTARTLYLGGITLFLFGVQAITGILLSLYYQPTPENAYNSILFIMNDVRFGWLIRSIHAWGANLMIIFCILHLLRVFFQGAYKPPREMTWVVGVVLLIVTLGFGFTGYLLPWDQRAFWATTVGSEIAGAIPGIGRFALEFLRAGPEITALTLSRFFGTHVLVLPVTLTFVILIHLVMVHQQGLADPTEPARFPDDLPEESAVESLPMEVAAGVEPYRLERREEKGKLLLPFFPNYLLDEVIAWYVILAIIVVLASLFPAGLEEQADPFKTPPHIKPEWYFLALYQALKLIPRVVGVTAPIVGILILLVVPFLDRNPQKVWRRRPIAVGLGIVVLVATVVLTVWGWIS